MKPMPTEQRRNSPSITSMFATGVNAIAHWKDKPAECLGNAAIYSVANFCQSILTIKFLDDERSEGRSVSRQIGVEPVLCQHLGMVLEDGVYSQDPAYNSPPTLSTSTITKTGVYMWDTTVLVISQKQWCGSGTDWLTDYRHLVPKCAILVFNYHHPGNWLPSSWTVLFHCRSYTTPVSDRPFINIACHVQHATIPWHALCKVKIMGADNRCHPIVGNLH